MIAIVADPTIALTLLTALGLPNEPAMFAPARDLLWVKVIDRDGNESASPIGRNPNFRNTNSRYAPAYGRFGMRLTFQEQTSDPPSKARPDRRAFGAFGVRRYVDAPIREIAAAGDGLVAVG